MPLSNESMMSLGGFKFAANSAAYQQLRHAAEYRWSEQQRISRDPALQFTGKGRETIDLSGVIYPAEFNSGIDQVAAMRKLAAGGKPLTLIAAPQGSVGHIDGDWVIQTIEETGTLFAQGGSPRKIEFRMNLQRYGGDA